MSAALDLRDSDPALDKHADDDDDVDDDDDENLVAALDTSRTNFRMAIISPRSLGSSSSSSRSLSSSSSPPVEDVSGTALDSRPNLLVDSSGCERTRWAGDSSIRKLSEEVAEMLSSSTFSGIKLGCSLVVVVTALSSVFGNSFFQGCG